MSTSVFKLELKISGKERRVAIVKALWNGHITNPLAEQAVETLKGAGAEASVFEVPGTVELTFAASQLIESSAFDAVIVIGCVVRGDTPHFDYVCQSVTQGVTTLNADCDTPVIFCVLTVENDAQAQERVDGTHSRKGVEAANTALAMIQFKDQVEQL